MNLIAVSFLVIFHLVQIKSDEAPYTNMYDGIDLDEILANERLLNGYVNCLLENGPCTPDGKELKKNIPDAIENDCKKCTEKQKEGADKVMQYIIDNRPEDWTKLEEKYDSDGDYKNKYLVKKRVTEEVQDKQGNNRTEIESREDI